MKKTLLLTLSVLVAMVTYGKKQVVVETPVAEPVQEVDETQVTEECLMNVSLFNEACKNKQYADAYEPWLEVFNTCPTANKAIYSKGADILDWKIKQCTTDAEKKEFIDLLMKLYDKRIKYFGDDPKYPKAYILGQKGVDYCDFHPEDTLKTCAYEWLKAAIDGMGKNVQMTVVQKFNEVSSGLYKSDPNKYGSQYLADYQTMSDILGAVSSDSTSKYASVAKDIKSFVDETFVRSGVADCAKLDEIYGVMVQKNLGDVDLLGKIMYLYRKVGCGESEVYFTAAAASHKLRPTAESAAGCGRMCIKKKEYTQAIKYFEEALKLTDATEKEDKADYYFAIAYVEFTYLNKYPEARTNIKKSLEMVPDQGKCYLLWALVYASSKPYGSDIPAAKAAILNKTVYWLAVDKCQKAKAVDETVAKEANEFISSYSKYFPTKEEMFDLPNEFSGESFTVGGWIQERTTKRAAK